MLAASSASKEEEEVDAAEPLLVALERRLPALLPDESIIPPVLASDTPRTLSSPAPEPRRETAALHGAPTSGMALSSPRLDVGCDHWSKP